MKDWAVVVVACSATESTKGLVVVRNGLIALRYLKDGRPTDFLNNDASYQKCGRTN